MRSLPRFGEICFYPEIGRSTYHRKVITFHQTSRRYIPTERNIPTLFHIFSANHLTLALHVAAVKGIVSNTRKIFELNPRGYCTLGPHRISRDEADFESPYCGLCRHDQCLTMALPCNSRAHTRIAGPPSCNKITDFKIV
jgi:hypothetical protein